MKQDKKKTSSSTIQESFVKASKTFGKYKEREEIWRSLEAVMTLLTAILLLVFAINPTVKAISDLLAEIRNKKELSQRMKVKIDKVIGAQMNYANVQENIFLLDQYYPEAPRLAEGAAQLIGIAKQHNLNLKQVGFSGFDFAKMMEIKQAKEAEKNASSGIGFFLEAEGDYREIKSFLSAVYQARRGMIVSGYQISPVEEEDSSKLTVHVEGRLLFYGAEIKK